MIKPIMPNNIGRKVLATAMFATAVASTNAANLSIKENAAASDTTLVNPQNFDIIKIHSYHLGTYSFDRNKKLDKIYLKYCNSEIKRADKKETLKSLYENFGTYGATIEIQKMIDEHFLQDSYNRYLDHFALTQKDRKNFNKVTSEFEEWRRDVFYKDLNEVKAKIYSKREVLSAESAIKAIDNYVLKTNFISNEDRSTYAMASERFKSMQKDKESVMAKSDLLAYKVHLLNVFAFKNYFFDEAKSYDSYLYRFYFQGFVSGEASIKP